MSTGTEKISINLSGMTNQEIKSQLISIYDKINKPPTKEVGYDLFLKLVHKNLYSPSQMNFIINHVSEFIIPLEPKEKDPCLKLLSLIFYSPSNEEESIDSKIYFPFLSPVLTTLQNLIKDSNSPIFSTIANIFAEIVQNIMPTDIEASNIELDQEEKTAYEMMQGFCIYNMKYEDKSNRIVGSLCLTKLVENCPVVLQKQYMKLIWEVIMNLIDKKNFNAKYELLNCLISLILGAENLFTPYAHNTLYKVLDFLADTDWLKRKLALNVIYTLIFYCKDEILPLKEHIISFLRSLKTDKVKEVREVCLLILKIFSEDEQKNKENTKDKNKSNNSSLNSTKKKFGNKPDNKNVNKNKNNINNTSNMNKGRMSMPKKNGNKFNKNLDVDKSNKFGECMVPEKNDKNNENIKSDYNKKENVINKNRASFELNQGSTEQENQLNTNTTNNSISKKIGMSSNIKNNQKENNESTPINQNSNKLVNRKDDKTFINEKMVIKPDPNKSIFKSSPNPAFFSQAKKKSKDIVLVSKGDSQKFKNDINNNKNEIIIEIKEKPQEKKTIEEKKENINNDKKINNANNTNNNNENKGKEVSNIKNKVAPIKRNKFIKKVPDKEEKEGEKEDDKEKKEKEERERKEKEEREIKEREERERKERERKEKERKEKEERERKERERKEREKKEREERERKEREEKEILKKNEIENEEMIENYKKDEDIEINDYKTFLNKNEQKSKINKKESSKGNYDPNIIDNLLIQMNSLSQKQLSLIDIMDNIQMETQGQINQLNKRISKLEKNVEDLNNELYYLKNE